MRLGAVTPAPATETLLYAPAAGVTAVIKIFVANRVSSPAFIKVVHRPGAGATVDADYLTFDEAIPGNEARRSAVFDITNPAQLHVVTDITGVTFQANGIERT